MKAKTKTKKIKENIDPELLELNFDTGKEEPYNGDGRPPVMTRHVVHKLETAFANGYTDIQACIYAKVGRSTVHDYCKKYPSFSDRKEELKKSLDMHAKSNMATLIKAGDKDSSKWWLERKCKDEFSLRTENTGPDGGAIPVSYSVQPATPEALAAYAKEKAKVIKI